MARLTGFSPLVRKVIVERATDFEGTIRCERCGEGYGDVAQIHHRLPRRAGGSRRPEVSLAANGLLLDTMCHLWIESYRAESYENGWLLKSGQTPTRVSVLRRGEWVQLLDSGDVIPVAAHDDWIEIGAGQVINLDNENGPGLMLPHQVVPGPNHYLGVADDR
jgi:5-methylcytosine-specific restriction protein A